MTTREPEVIEALQVAQRREDFIMVGGAGSGKTHSMLNFLHAIYKDDPAAVVACVTFTNVAVNEIKERFPLQSVQVSTIHEFFWSLIDRYQKNLRESLLELVDTGEIESSSSETLSIKDIELPIQYKEWSDVRAGQISHDDVLKLSLHLATQYSAFRKILIDSFDYILIDEFQDTPKQVLEIFLEKIEKPSNRHMRLCLFGDGEQAIHEEGKGKKILDRAIEEGRLRRIEKKENRRNPSSVIAIINHLRTDGLRQKQSNYPSAPNFGVTGTARFIYTMVDEKSIEQIKTHSLCDSWDFSNSKTTKVLFLGKAKIAEEGKFHRLMQIYDKDRVIEYSKKIKKELLKKGITISDSTTFGDILDKYQGVIKPTPAQEKAFDADLTLIQGAAGHSFTEICSTSTNSDKLLGTKKVSEYDDRNRAVKRDPLINHLIKIQTLVDRYQKKDFNGIIKNLDIEIDSIATRDKVYDDLECISTMGAKSISEVLEFVEESGLLRRSKNLDDFQKRHGYRCTRVLEVSYAEIQNLFNYVEDYAPFSTQHGVKGSEWDNIFVSLGSNWNMYNYEKLFLEPQGTTPVINRSRMMLYVACSRAKKNLLVHAHKPVPDMLEQARMWFGNENVIEII